MKSEIFQCGYRSKTGEAIIGFVRIMDTATKRKKVTWMGAPEYPGRDLGSFTAKEWRNQTDVNAALRSQGLLWRRSVDEAQYEATRLLESSLKPL